MSMFRSLAHACLSGIFITGGASAFLEPGGRPQKVADAGIPAPKQSVILNGAAMVIGGTALALNIFPRLASLLLLGTMIPTTLVGHPFWQEESEASRKMQQTQFMKNLGLIGGLLLVIFE